MSAGAFAPTLLGVCQYAALAGVASHWGYFIRGDHLSEAPLLSLLYFVLPIFAFAAQLVFGKPGVISAALRTAGLSLSFLVPLWTSMIVYRAFFHRLRNFPGPFPAKVSKFWHVSIIAPKMDNYRQLEALRQKYGDFVRTGPTELSIFHPDVIQATLAPGSKCVKSAWYDIALPLRSLHTERSRTVHDKRRKIWDRGFSAKALRGYESRVGSFTQQLAERLSASAGQVVSATREFQYFAFDVMGDIAFGKSFGMMKSGQVHFVMKILKEGMAPLGIMTPMPWLLHSLKEIPGATKALHRLIDWSGEQVEQRRQMQGQVDSSDVMSNLIDEFEKSSKTADDRQWLTGDSRLIIVAGSDTTSASLTNLAYHLASDPSQIAKLREELDPLVPDVATVDQNAIKDAPHLNAVINETLRLYPPVPGGVFRDTPPEGITIGNTFVPGNVSICAPLWSVQRLESCYERPHEFIPERWYSKPELAKNKSTFAPFSLGPFSCVGKQLALMELRMAITTLVLSFDMKLAPGEDGSQLIDHLKDCFTVDQKDLNVIFSKRTQK